MEKTRAIRVLPMAINTGKPPHGLLHPGWSRGRLIVSRARNNEKHESTSACFWRGPGQAGHFNSPWFATIVKQW